MMHRWSRRAVMTAIAAVSASPVLAQRRPRGQEPAPRIEDPRATAFDIGPPHAPWRIFCGLPAVPAPPQGYSVIVALDGNGTLPLLWDLRATLAPEAPVLLVGIGYPVDTRLDPVRRWYDLTSPGMVPVPPQEGMRGPGDRPTGGSAAFLAMISGMLIPELQTRFPINRDEMTLFGHSLGGLFSLQALIEQPRLFARYAAADPSTWWNAEEPLHRVRAFANGVVATGGAVSPAIPVLILSSGERLPQIVPLLSGIPGIAVTHRAHPNETHGSVLAPAAREAFLLHLGRPID